ncbi:MAG TPA: hypothetical protein EYQ34_03295 [Acidimicrobiia bacterium]|nr:hypothetical protein [Acidimicrobiia bacterium]
MRKFAVLLAFLFFTAACGNSSPPTTDETTKPAVTSPSPTTSVKSEDSVTPPTTAAATPTTTTATPTTTTAQAKVQTDYEKSLEKYYEAKALMLSSGDFSPFECAASIVGADRAGEFITADPTAEELSLLETCFDDSVPQTEQAAPPTTVRHGAPPTTSAPAPTIGPINPGPPVDPANPPRIAVNNFIDLAPHISITKLRSVYGHNYTFGDDEHDPTGQSCRSMKHYFDAYSLNQRWSGNFGSYDTKGTVKFYAPADGTIRDLVPSSSSAGPEYQFTIQSSEYPRLAFKFHHVDLLENLQNGGTVVAGQHLGHIARFNGQAEIATYVVLGPGTGEYISFFDVMSDEVFAEYQARGISSRSQMSITKEARDASPIPCDLSDGQGGKFIATGMAEEAFAIWQSGVDNWVFLTD